MRHLLIKYALLALTLLLIKPAFSQSSLQCPKPTLVALTGETLETSFNLLDEDGLYGYNLFWTSAQSEDPGFIINAAGPSGQLSWTPDQDEKGIWIVRFFANRMDEVIFDEQAGTYKPVYRYYSETDTFSPQCAVRFLVADSLQEALDMQQQWLNENELVAEPNGEGQLASTQPPAPDNLFVSPASVNLNEPYTVRSVWKGHDSVNAYSLKFEFFEDGLRTEPSPSIYLQEADNIAARYTRQKSTEGSYEYHSQLCRTFNPYTCGNISVKRSVTVVPPPSAPTIEDVDVDGDNITLEWRANPGTPPHHYCIEATYQSLIDSDSGHNECAQELPGGTTTHTFVGLRQGVRSFWVHACNAAGDCSRSDKDGPHTINPQPPKPASVNAALTDGDDDIRLTWSASEYAEWYDIYVKWNTDP